MVRCWQQQVSYHNPVSFDLANVMISCGRESQVLEAFREEARFKFSSFEGRRCDWQRGRHGEADDDQIGMGSLVSHTCRSVMACCLFHVVVVSDGVGLFGSDIDERETEHVSPKSSADWIRRGRRSIPITLTSLIPEKTIMK